MANMKKELTNTISRNVEDFTINFYKMMAGKIIKGNLVSSALSAHVVLAMAACGAKYKTAEEMRKVLNFPDNVDDAYQGFQEFINMLHNVPNVILKLANKIFVSDSITMKDEFKSLLENHFYSESESLNFKNSADAIKIVNQWCTDKTDGKINEILTEDDLPENLTMILLNAVYFKGLWKEKFDKLKTDMQPFYVDKETVIQVPTMHIKENLSYREITELNARSVMLPYENEDVVLEIIVPHEIDGLKHIEKNLEKINHMDEKSRYIKRNVTLSLPRFKIKSEYNLNSHLEEMGMIDMFSNRANFLGISDTPMRIGKVIQKAYIEVNEEGSEAAAITAIFAMGCCLPPPPVTLQVDRPFLFRIYHKYHKVTLFTGRIDKPHHD